MDLLGFTHFGYYPLKAQIVKSWTNMSLLT